MNKLQKNIDILNQKIELINLRNIKTKFKRFKNKYFYIKLGCIMF